MLTLQLVLIHYRYADKFSSFGTYTRPGQEIWQPQCFDLPPVRKSTVENRDLEPVLVESKASV